ncbi:MAG TPA: hypothetical protein DCG57_14815, partial [Candidatus Riflebacteria bacterium]|nr:hypothetical protein [Candidatus Riflebacteria bacterium]
IINSDDSRKGKNGLYVRLYEWNKTTKPGETGYEVGSFVASMTTHELGVASSTNGSSTTGGNFEFLNLSERMYALYFGNADDEPKYVDPDVYKMKDFETNTTKAPNYIHHVSYRDVKNNKELTILTDY